MNVIDGHLQSAPCAPRSVPEDRVIMSVRDRNGRLKWRVGGVYAMVPKRGQHGIGFIRVTSIERIPVQQMSEHDALDEGVRSVSEYEAMVAYAGASDGAA